MIETVVELEQAPSITVTVYMAADNPEIEIVFELVVPDVPLLQVYVYVPPEPLLKAIFAAPSLDPLQVTFEVMEAVDVSAQLHDVIVIFFITESFPQAVVTKSLIGKVPALAYEMPDGF